jgi:hypothetical protein
MCYTASNVGSVAFYTFVDTTTANVVKEALFYSDKVNNKKMYFYGGK